MHVHVMKSCILTPPLPKPNFCHKGKLRHSSAVKPKSTKFDYRSVLTFL